MSRGWFRRLRYVEDDGVVAVVVAITLIVLVGMLVLTYDLGRIVSVRRDMVHASDAAVLAAARACALERSSGAAQVAAQELIDGNTTNLNPTSMTTFDAPQCEALNESLKYATVGARTTVEYYFAPIFGFESGPMNSTATAAWGPAIGVLNPVPLRLLDSAVGACISNLEGYQGPECAFVFDNDGEGPSSTWGFLDFPEGWPTAPPNPMACSSQSGGASDIIDYLSGLKPDFTPEIWAQPVYVCAEGGLSATVVNWVINWLNDQQDNALIFPVMAPPASEGGFDPIVTPGGQSYPIVGFVSLTVVGAWKGQQARQNCNLQSTNSSLFCIQFRYEGTDVVEGIPGSGTYYNLQAIRLVE